jgi:hypothetical protein
MGHTMESYQKYEQLSDEERKGYATRPALVEKIEYPMTVQGQCDFMEDFMSRVKNVADGKGKGFFWWEPAWIPVKGSGWATPASLKYMKDPGPCGNEWANQALSYFETVSSVPPVIMCESLHGILSKGTTVFPQSIGMGASFDPDLMRRVAEAIGKEARALRADYILRAVEMPAGEHTIEWSYRAPNWALVEGIAMACSVVILAAFLLTLIYVIRNARRQENKA